MTFLINGDGALEPLQFINVMEFFKVRHILLGFAMVSLFLNVKAGGEDGTIVASKIESTLVFTGSLNIDEQITSMRIYYLNNPEVFDEYLQYRECNVSKTSCKYFVEGSSLTEGLYVVEMYYTGSSVPITEVYMH